MTDVSRSASAPPSGSLRPPLRWSEFVHMRHTGRDPHKPRIDKTRTLELIAENGLRGPESYGVFDRIEDIDFAALPESFVLKPSELNGNRGVMLLYRIAGGLGYWDSMQRRRLTVAQIVEEQNGWARIYRQKRGRALQFLAEELVVGENGPGKIPYDYKIHVFAGEPKFIAQIDRNGKADQPPGTAFFDGTFAPLAEGDPRVMRGRSRRVSPAVPACAAEMLANAVAISESLKTPYIRIDCYASVKGPVVGEITVSPGGSTYKFTDAFELELGREWTEACARVGQPVPLFDEAWATEKRSTSGLPLTLAEMEPPMVVTETRAQWLIRQLRTRLPVARWLRRS